MGADGHFDLTSAQVWGSWPQEGPGVAVPVGCADALPLSGGPGTRQQGWLVTGWGMLGKQAT